MRLEGMKLQLHVLFRWRHGTFVDQDEGAEDTTDEGAEHESSTEEPVEIEIAVDFRCHPVV